MIDAVMVPREGIKREHGKVCATKAEAVPATVNGEPIAMTPLEALPEKDRMGDWEGGDRRRPMSQETCHHRLSA